MACGVCCLAAALSPHSGCSGWPAGGSVPDGLDQRVGLPCLESCLECPVFCPPHTHSSTLRRPPRPPPLPPSPPTHGTPDKRGEQSPLARCIPSGNCSIGHRSDAAPQAVPAHTPHERPCARVPSRTRALARARLWESSATASDGGGGRPAAAADGGGGGRRGARGAPGTPTTNR